MKTRVRDFIDALTAEIKALPDSKNDYDVLIRLESEISIERLMHLLAKFKLNYAQSDEMVSVENLKPFYEFLQERWLNIQKTDAIYPHTPKSAINCICYLLARSLAKVSDQHPYDLLMPSVRFINYDLKLSEFILRDDGITPLEVVEGFACLEDETVETKIQESYLLRKDSPIRSSRNKLSLSEVHRILCHSKDAPGYWKAIYSTRNTTEEAKFVEALKSDNYRVTASYSTEGEKCLINCILHNVTTRDELARFMAKHLTKEHGWQHFLDKICSLSPENLFRVMLDMDIEPTTLRYNGKTYSDTTEFHKAMLPDVAVKLPTVLKSDLINDCDDLHIRALLLCLLRTYKLTRNEGPVYTSLFGHSIGYRLWGATTYSKEDKLKACDALINLLLSDTPLENIKIDPVFKKNEGPLMNDTLGSITKILLDISDKKAENRLAPV